MRRITFGLLVAGVVLATPGVASSGFDMTFEYSPTSGPPGTVISVSGTDCFPSGEEFPSRVDVVLSTPGGEGTVIVSGTFTPNQETGAWSGTLTVPAGTAPGPYDIQAFCYLLDESGGDLGTDAVGPPGPPAINNFTYTPNPGPFTVTAPAPTPAPPAPAGTDPVAPGAPAPVVAAPSFTG